MTTSTPQPTDSAAASAGIDVAAPAASAFPALVRQEIKHYVRHWLFVTGVVGTAALTVARFADDTGSSSTMDMIGPAALLGVLGMFVMASLVARSDRAAAAGGAVAVSQSTRTMALAAATVVPLTAALAWYASAIVLFRLQPPAAYAVPFAGISTAHVFAVIFALGVLPALTGPIVGLVVTRWQPWRGSVAVTAVVVIAVTIVMQGNFVSTWRWHQVWPWTYWYGPIGWDQTDQAKHWVALPGSPFAWIGYLLALAVLGVLLALCRDPEADRRRRLIALAVVAAIAVAAVVLSMTTGLPDPLRNPVAES